MILCKDILKKTISSVFYILHKIIPWDRLFAFRNAIYSLWISSLLKSLGITISVILFKLMLLNS